MNSAYAKEVFTSKCEAAASTATEMLDRIGLGEASGGDLTPGERACLSTLIPQLKIAAELFRQCAKNKEVNDGRYR